MQNEKRAGPIESYVPKVVRFAAQSTPSQNRVSNNVFQQVQVNATQKTVSRDVCLDNSHIEVNACGNSRRKSRRTTIIDYRSAYFGQDNTIVQ